MTIYEIGTGIANVTDPAIGLKLQGMADPFQETKGVETSLYARAFIVADSDKRVAIISADIWTGTQAVKSKVIRRLKDGHENMRQKKGYGDTYTEDNVLISGTHTHSGPGGYSGNILYDDNCGGFDSHNFECIVSGMVTAIENAHANLAPGKIYINTGLITEDCGNQRSAEAFKNNEEFKKNKKVSQTDKEMLLLKFVAMDKAGELPIGTINWYPIHPTDRGQANRFVSGDNKGEASRLFEKKMRTNYSFKDTFVAAFANSNCGDVSGNVKKDENGNLISSVPNVVTATVKIPPDPGSIGDPRTWKTRDQINMETHGKAQYEKAKELFDSATKELSGNVDYRHTRIDMANIRLEKENSRTWPAALGLSFAAGSSEDSVPIPPTGVREGITEFNITASERIAEGVVIAALAGKFGITKNKSDFIGGHMPKPIVLSPGLLAPPIIPNILPIQILKIGNLVITGVPGELTTMAGRRLKKTVLDELKGSGADHLALATYANDYSQYITTREEYIMQHYEGASTLFGPHTLRAYQQEFKKLATALKNKTDLHTTLRPKAPSSKDNRRITIRNLTRTGKKAEVFKQDDDFFAPATIPGMDKTVPAKREIAYFIPKKIDKVKIRIGGSKLLNNVTVGMLIIIQANGEPTVSNEYTPPEHRLSDKSTIGRKGPIEWLQPVLHMMLSDQPEAIQSILHMMNSDGPGIPIVIGEETEPGPVNTDQPQVPDPGEGEIGDETEVSNEQETDNKEEETDSGQINTDQPQIPDSDEGEIGDETEVSNEQETDDKEEETDSGQMEKESTETNDVEEDKGREQETRKERRERKKREQNRREREEREKEEKRKKARKERRERKKREQNRKD